jgi:hypothetical protein
MSLQSNSHKEVKSIAKQVNAKIRAEHKLLVKAAILKIKTEDKERIKRIRDKFKAVLKKKLVPIAGQSKANLIKLLEPHKSKVKDIKLDEIPPPPKQKTLTAQEEQEMKKTFEEAKKTPLEGKPQYVTKNIGGKIRRIPVAKLNSAAAAKKEEKVKAFTVTGASGKKTQLYYKKGKEPPKTAQKPKVPKITVTEASEKKKKATKEVKSQLPKLKEKALKLRVAPKKKKEEEAKKPEGDSELKQLKKELKSKGVSKMVLKFIKNIKQANELLQEIEQSKEDEESEDKVLPDFVSFVGSKKKKEVENLVLSISKTRKYNISDQRDYFKELKEMGENWDTDARPRIKYDGFRGDEKELFDLMFPKIIEKIEAIKKSAEKAQAKADKAAKKAAAKANK